MPMSKRAKIILWCVIISVLALLILITVFTLSGTRHYEDNGSSATEPSRYTPNITDTLKTATDTLVPKGEAPTEAPAPAPVPAPTPAPAPSPGPVPDTVSKQSKTFATLGYHYNPTMNIHETQEINVYLGVNASTNAIRDTITKILKDEDPDKSPADTGKIEFKEQVPVYKYVSIDLTPLDSGIVIRKTPDATRQLFDLKNGNKWSWVIYSNSAEKSESKLLMIISSEDPAHLEKRYIRIKIHVERNFIRIFYNYLIEHPGDFLLKIIVPLVTFIGGIIFGKRSKKGEG